MKSIEIKTTQNVVLQYELADLRDRIVAYLIDLAIGVFGALLLVGIASAVFAGTTLSVVLIGILCMFIFYSLAFETLNQGQSPGKMAMRIQVVKTTSGQASFPDYAARWVFRLVDIYFSFGGIASILIASSSRSQRIGDIVANTTVIKLTPSMQLNLQDILSLHAKTNYTPVFAQAKQLQEEDVLLIKATLDRHRKYPNEAHLLAINKLAEKVADVLNLPSPASNQAFLQTVLKDYVVLTR